MSDFQSAFSEALGVSSDPTAEKVKRIIDSNSHPILKRLILRKMEAHARAHLDEPAGALIDWSKVDWNEVLGILLKILVAILPLLIL